MTDREKQNGAPARRTGAHAAPPKGGMPAPADRSGLEKTVGAPSKKDARQAAKAQAQAAKEQAKAAKEEAKTVKAEERRLRAQARKIARKKALRKLKIASIILLVLAALAGGGLAYWGWSVTNSPVNYPNLYIGDLPVGGLSHEQTLAALSGRAWDETVAEPLEVTLPTGVRFQVDPVQSGAVLTGQSLAEAAARYGRSGDWFSNLAAYLGCLTGSTDINQGRARLDTDYIRQCAQDGVDRFKAANASGGEVKVDEKKQVLRLVKGAGEMEIDLDLLCQDVSLALLNGEKTLNYDHIDNQLQMPDFDGIYKELAVEPADAHFVEGGYDVVDEVVGCSFDVEQAKSLWQMAGPGETVEVKLDITEPKVTGEELRSLLFRDKLGAMTTYYKSSTSNRINNIHLASDKINEYVMMPGDVFSYNDVVGRRTTEAGYLTADAYNNGEVVQSIGGGICQVSSTLYCAMLYANLETVSRTNHYFKVSYLDYGLDATVSWGGPEFKFRNNRDYPIKILTFCDDNERALTVEIWGTDVDGSYVELRTSRFAVNDDTYTDVQVGVGAQCIRTVYDKDGNYLYETKEPYGIYYFHDQDIHWPAQPDPDPGYTDPVPDPEPDPGDGGDDGGGGEIIEPEPDEYA